MGHASAVRGAVRAQPQAKRPITLASVVVARMKPLHDMLKMHVPDVDARISLGVWLHGWLTGALMEYDGSLTITQPSKRRASATGRAPRAPLKATAAQRRRERGR